MDIPARPAPSELPFPRYEALLLQARELVDNATTAGAALDFDTALEHAQTFDEVYRMPVVPLLSETALIDLDDTGIFRLAESLDTFMTFANDDNRLAAATLANDLHASLLYSPAGSKRLILDKVLGLSSSSERTIPEQLERRYFDGKTVDEKHLTVQGIVKRSRTYIARPR